MIDWFILSFYKAINTNSDPLIETTGGPLVSETSFLDRSGLLQPEVDLLIDNPNEQEDRAFLSTEKPQKHTKYQEVIRDFFASRNKFSD